jgi:hypothetical protein
VPPRRNTIEIDARLPAGAARISIDADGAHLRLGVAAARRLAADPGALRYRYEVAG